LSTVHDLTAKRIGIPQLRFGFLDKPPSKAMLIRSDRSEHHIVDRRNGNDRVDAGGSKRIHEPHELLMSALPLQGPLLIDVVNTGPPSGGRTTLLGDDS
jgi:hypothetical protein